MAGTPEVLVRRLLLLASGLATAAAIVLASSWQWSWVIAAVAGASGAAIAVGAGRRTARRQRTELTRLSELAERRAEQVAALSHELRTPLSMIKAAAELLLEQTPGPLTAQQGEFLQVIAQQCGQVIELSEGLLIQARIQAGLFTPRREPIDVSGLARDVVVAMRPLCDRRGQRITLDTPQVTRTIAADPTLVQQALTNLVSNASRFTSQGGSISVRVMEIDSGLAVYVTDDGAGMTREERRQLFRRFATGRPLEDGTGLGLVITKEVIEAHGGSIMVDTAAERGTTFLFTLPREEQT